MFQKRVFYSKGELHVVAGSMLALLLVHFCPLSTIAQKLDRQQQLQMAEADKLNAQVAQFYNDAKFSEAAPIAAKVLEITEKTLGPEHFETSVALHNQAWNYAYLNKLPEAVILGERALKIREKKPGPDHPDTAKIIMSLAEWNRALDKFEVAEQYLLRALRIMEKALGPEHSDTATSVSNLGRLYRQLGRLSETEPLYQRALKIREEKSGPEHIDTATSVGDLADLYFHQGNYGAAEPLFLRSLKITEKVRGPEHPSTAIVTSSLGNLYETQGNYASAEPQYKRTLNIHEKVFGPEHPGTAHSLKSLGKLYTIQKNFAAAEPLLTQALKIAEKTAGPESLLTAKCCLALGSMFDVKGNFPAAEPLVQRALRIYEKIDGSEHPDTATALSLLGELYKHEGNYTEAELTFQRVLRVYEKSFGPGHPNCISANFDIAQIQENRRNPESAALINRTIVAEIEHITTFLPSLSEKEQKMYINSRLGLLHFALSQSMRHVDQPENIALSVGWIANGKCIAQDALATRNLAMRDMSNPKAAPILKKLILTRQELAANALAIVETSKQSERQQRLFRLTSEEAKLEKELASTIGAKGEVKEWVSTEMLRRSLAPDSVLVDIARVCVFNFEKDQSDKPYLPSRYAAWITPPIGKGEPKLVDLGLASEIHSMLNPIRKRIQADGLKDGAIATKGEEGAVAALNIGMKKLSDRIWAPIASHIGSDTKSIILSPDGALWLAPWSALPIENDNKLLIEKYSLRLAMRGRDVANPNAIRLQTSSPVIFADPKFDSPSAEKKVAIEAVLKKASLSENKTMRGFSPSSLIPKVASLPNTGLEAKLIEPNVAKFAKSKPVLYSERYALESIVKELNRPKVAIFATHGFFLPDQELKLDARLSFAQRESRSVQMDSTGKPFENPLLRCGLLFAGCNQRDAATGNDDGILTGMEILSIDFRGTDLVVLSACETGIGDVKSGEGVAGLRQAFQLAGAKSVVASLWQVPDRDSAIIMNDFFENVAAGHSASNSMRQAQLKRIHARRDRYGAAHPLYWAAWTVTE